MIIVADQDMPHLDQTFARHGELRLRAGRVIRRRDLDGAQVLLVRSITRVNAKLLSGTGIRFVGTATIGHDHLDTGWMERHGIVWASAPGCNATAAAQYTLGMILLACARAGINPREAGAGIVGRGNVGSRVQALLNALGVATVACDPPLAEQGVDGLVPLKQALARGIVCLHVPLTGAGRHPTRHMMDQRALARMPDGALLVNTARGQVVEASALMRELKSGRLHAAVDVWPGEPDIDPDLVAACTVATPHVAGYSEQGRRNGTRMVYTAFCRWQGVAPVESVHRERRRQIDLAAGGREADAVIQATRVRTDDQGLRQAMRQAPWGHAAAFDALREAYALRGEFRHCSVRGAVADSRQMLASLGFRVR